MARFERQDPNAESGSASVATATDELRSTVEQQLSKIVEAAEARAGEIESQALDKARRIERESEHLAREAFQASIDRAYSLLTAVESMERELRSLRNETETLVAELEASSAASGRLTEMPESAPTDADTEEDVDEELSALATADEVTPGDSTSEDSTSPEVREMIREQLVEIRDSGQERSEAESFLMRFTQGQRHLDLLDEIYDDQSEESRPSTSRRRRLRRRRAKQQSDDQE